MESVKTSDGQGAARHCISARQFSLLTMLLLVLVVCVFAAYLGERRRRVDAVREMQKAVLKAEAQSRRPIGRGITNIDPLNVLTINDPRLVHIKALRPSIGSAFGPGLAWSWRVYLPPERHHWWIYISQGEEWEAREARYRDGGVSGSHVKATGAITVMATITWNQTGEAYLQAWTDGVQAARLSDAGQEMIRSEGETTEIVVGQSGQVTVAPQDAPGSHIELLRWNRVLKTDEATDVQKPPKEYGLSIYLVDESPMHRP